MQRDPTITALAACCLSCLKAANGHHRRWAVKRCTDALVAAGTPPTIATRSALAMAALTADEVRSVATHQAKVAGSKKAPAPMGARTPHKPVPTAKQNVTFCPPKPPEQIKPTGEPVRTEKTIEARDTTVRPAAKWQMQQLPPDPRFPSFASVRPGVNPDTGMAWDGRA